MQTGAMLFNTSGVPVGTYNTVQVIVDPNNPGTIVAACQATNANQEGCVNYPIEFQTPGAPVLTSLGTPFVVAKNGNVPLLLQLSLVVTEVPSVNADNAYQVDVTATQANAGSFLAAVTGSITKSGTTMGVHLLPLTVYAELTGTDTVISSAPTAGNGTYTLIVPGRWR